MAEAAGLGAFVLMSCPTAVFFHHPAAWGWQRLSETLWIRRVGVGLEMSLMLTGMTHNRWGQRSGMSLNPGRTLGLAVPAGQPALWPYLVAPTAGVGLAARLF